MTKWRAWARPGPLLVGVSAALAIVLTLDLVPALRGGEPLHWQWPHEPVALGRAAVLVAALGAYCLGTARLARTGRGGWIRAWAVLGVVALSLLATWVRAGNPLRELYYRTVSLTATGPYTAAGLIDWSDGAWHDWPAVMVEFREMSQHVALSPPGLPLIYAGAAQGFGTAPGAARALQRALVPLQCDNYTLLRFTAPEWAAAVVGLLMPVWAGLTALPLFAAARHLQVGALWLAPLWALVPAALMFAGSWNTAYPALSVAAFWLLLRGYDARRGAVWWAGAGLLAGVLTFANFSLVPLIGLLGAYALLRHALNERRRRPRWFPLRVGAWFALGLTLPWALWWLGAGSTPWAMLEVAFDRHLELDRPYVPWLWMHTWEWALLGGLPLVMAALLALARWRPGRDVLPLALFVTLAVLVLSGAARGETGRVWLFFMPFVLLSAGQWIARLGDAGERVRAWRELWAAQALLLVALASTWAVMGAPDVPSRPEPPPAMAAAHAHDARFEAGFRLVGWSAEAQSGAILLRLNWRNERQVTTPYYFAALPVAPDGAPGEPIVWQPDGARYPVTCWEPGQTVTDTVRLPLPDSPATGEWFVSLQAFADADHPLDTVSVLLPDGTSDRQVGLGPVWVGGPQ